MFLSLQSCGGLFFFFLCFLTSSTSATESSYIQNVMLDKPSSFWRLNTMTSVQMVDVIQGKILTSIWMTSAFYMVPGIFPDASPTNVAVASFHQYYTETPAFTQASDTLTYTIELWGYNLNTNVMQLFQSPDYAMFGWSGGTGLTYSDQSTSQIFTATSQPTGWNHFVVTMNHGLFRAYVNGDHVGTITKSLVIPDYIQFGTGFSNAISNLALYNYTLSAERVLVHYQDVMSSNLCAQGYFGIGCLSHYCDSNPCNGNGKCTGTNTGFTCDCYYKFIGTTCATSKCSLLNCQGNSTCDEAIYTMEPTLIPQGVTISTSPTDLNTYKELGLSFFPNPGGLSNPITIVGMRWYSTPQAAFVATTRLWSLATSTVINSKTYNTGTISVAGWQTVYFDSPTVLYAELYKLYTITIQVGNVFIYTPATQSTYYLDKMAAMETKYSSVLGALPTTSVPSLYFFVDVIMGFNTTSIQPSCSCPYEYSGPSCATNKCSQLACQNNGVCNFAKEYFGLDVVTQMDNAYSEVGVKFRYTGTQELMGLRYYSPVTTSESFKITLWNLDTNLPMFKTELITTAKSIGWQELPLGKSFQLKTTTNYMLAISRPGYAAPIGTGVYDASTFSATNFIVTSTAFMGTTTPGLRPAEAFTAGTYIGISPLLSASDPQCICPLGFSGPNCTTSACSALSCQNGGQCTISTTPLFTIPFVWTSSSDSPTLTAIREPATGFRIVDASANMKGLRYYIPAGVVSTTSTVARLWSVATRSLLASMPITFTGGGAARWDTFLFSSNISLTANTEYQLTVTTTTFLVRYQPASSVSYNSEKFILLGDSYGSVDGQFPNQVTGRASGLSVVGIDPIIETLNATCSCPVGFLGTDCAITTACSFSPCFNGGICALNGTTNYTCTCAGSFYGRTCNQSYCDPNPCQNGGKCNIGKGQFSEVSITTPTWCVGTNCLLNEVGELFQVTEPGWFTGVRLYINPDFPVQGMVGKIWFANGTQLVNKSINTAGTGWQHAIFTNPLAVKPGISYMASGNVQRFGFVAPNFSLTRNSLQHLGGGGYLADPWHVFPWYATNQYLLVEPIFLPATSTFSSATCTCNPGYSGSTCLTSVCSNNPCINNGTCTPVGISGYNCTYCINSPCKNGGICAALVNDYKCTNCTTGFFGKDCTSDYCTSVPCLHGGLCTANATGFTCGCLSGFSGLNCSITACSATPCMNGGTCSLTGVGGYNCTCAAGFFGTNCMDTYCTSNPCAHGGVCTSNSTTYSCACDYHFTGRNCATDKCTVCQNNATCSYTLPNTEPICNCTLGNYGDTCASNYCMGNPCQNNGSCIALQTSFQCTCAVGWTGVNCTTWVNNCAGSPCLHNGTCTNAFNSYTCACAKGFFGARCEANYCDAPGLCGNGTCEALENSYYCTCNLGYHGVNCEINYCGDNPCGVHGTHCEALVDSYLCTCATGWFGMMCQTNYCDINSCANGATCVAQTSSYVCNCPVGYQLPYCIHTYCDNNPCQNGANCTALVASAQCTCATGFYDAVCASNYCMPDTCSGHGTCEALEVGFECHCASGYFDSTCESQYCDANPCQNGGSCEGRYQGYECICVAGYDGEQCTNVIDYCELQFGICGSHGSCQSSLNAYTCLCEHGFEGEHCQSQINNCLTADCHEGDCVNGVGSFTCTCHPGYTGVDCTTRIDHCLGQDCQSGVCHNELTEHRCECTAGYSGIDCSVLIDNCLGVDCHTGRCLNAVNSYTCVCDGTGYSGLACDILIDNCTPGICGEHGTCSNGINTFACVCEVEFEGVACETLINQCILNNPCQHNALCMSAYQSTTCACPDRYEGTYCEYIQRVLAYNPLTNTSLASYAVYAAGGVFTSGETNVIGIIASQSITSIGALNLQGVVDTSQNISQAVNRTYEALMSFTPDNILIPHFGSEGETMTYSGTVLEPRVYRFDDNTLLFGDVVLNGTGLYVFQFHGNAYFDQNFKVTLINGAKAEDVFWVTDHTAILHEHAQLQGSLYAHGNIEAKAGVITNGALIAITGSVTLQDASAALPLGSELPTFPITEEPGSSSSSSSTGGSSSAVQLSSSSPSSSSSSPSSSSSDHVSSTGVSSSEHESSSSFSSASDHTSSSSLGVSSSEHESPSEAASSSGYPSSSSSSSGPSVSSHPSSSSSSSSSTGMSSSSSSSPLPPPLVVANATCDQNGRCICHAGLYPVFHFNETLPSFVFTVAPKTESNPYFGQGSTFAFFVNGVESPSLNFIAHSRVVLDTTALTYLHPLYLTDSQLGGGAGQKVFGEYFGERVEVRIGEIPMVTWYYQDFKLAFMGGVVTVLPNPLEACLVPPVILPSSSSSSSTAVHSSSSSSSSSAAVHSSSSSSSSTAVYSSSSSSSSSSTGVISSSTLPPSLPHLNDTTIIPTTESDSLKLVSILSIVGIGLLLILLIAFLCWLTYHYYYAKGKYKKAKKAVTEKVGDVKKAMSPAKSNNIIKTPTPSKPQRTEQSLMNQQKNLDTRYGGDYPLTLEDVAVTIPSNNPLVESTLNEEFPLLMGRNQGRNRRYQ